MGISTHILDTNLGRPATNVPITLFEFRDSCGGGGWHKVGSAFTDLDGRCRTLLGDYQPVPTDYKLSFNVGVYFYNLQVPALYPYIEVVFRVADPLQHYHIPLLLTANGYTTYRGS